jgi:hypothetical protein
MASRAATRDLSAIPRRPLAAFLWFETASSGGYFSPSGGNFSPSGGYFSPKKGNFSRPKGYFCQNEAVSKVEMSNSSSSKKKQQKSVRATLFFREKRLQIISELGLFRYYSSGGYTWTLRRAVVIFLNNNVF